MRITKTAKKAMLTTPGVINALAYEMKKSESTIRRWIAAESPMLTTVQALHVIQKETGLSQHQIVTQ
jgi:hypothetical protein